MSSFGEDVCMLKGALSGTVAAMEQLKNSKGTIDEKCMATEGWKRYVHEWYGMLLDDV